MKKKIFLNMCALSLACVFLVSIITTSVLFNFSTDRSKQELYNQGYYIAGVLNTSSDKLSFLQGLDYRDGATRLTLISPQGKVIYDSEANAPNMENHADRKEFINAQKQETGEDIRLSKTLDTQTIYYAIKLDNSYVIRLANTQKSIFGITKRLVLLIIFASIIVSILSVFFARKMTKSIVKPINNLDLSNPMNNENIYDELSPLLHKIYKQKLNIGKQFSQLKEKQEEFELIINGMTEGLVLLDNNSYVISINKSAIKMLGKNDDRKYIGENILLLNHNMLIRNAVKNALDGKAVQEEIKVNEQYYHIYASPVLRESLVRGSVLLIVDVTDKFKAEKMRREFSANVSHELKTPLTTIKGYAEMLENGMAGADNVMLFGEKIHNESKRLLSLINDIIRISNLDEKSIEYVFEKIDLFKSASGVVGNLKQKAELGKIKLHLEIESQNSDESIVIMGFPAMIEELLVNLIDNAIKYNKIGGEVFVTISKQEGKPFIKVSDTGIGIPTKYQSHIFERFYTVDKSRSKLAGGTGLGLSIVKHIAQLHNASISLESKENIGTTISVFWGNTKERNF